MTARQIATAWREAETGWLEYGELEHARICGMLARYWSQPSWRRFLGSDDCFVLHQELMLSTRRMLNIVKQ